MDVEPGQLVKSLVGRDKEKHYLVIGLEGDRVVLADGRGRPVSRPKKKNLKHLQSYRYIVPGLKERIRQGSINDTEVRNILNTLLEKNDNLRLQYLRNFSDGES